MFVVVVEEEHVLNLYFGYFLFSSDNSLLRNLESCKNERIMKGSYQIGVTEWSLVVCTRYVCM